MTSLKNMKPREIVEKIKSIEGRLDYLIPAILPLRKDLDTLQALRERDPHHIAHTDAITDIISEIVDREHEVYALEEDIRLLKLYILPENSRDVLRKRHRMKKAPLRSAEG